MRVPSCTGIYKLIYVSGVWKQISVLCFEFFSWMQSEIHYLSIEQIYRFGRIYSNGIDSDTGTFCKPELLKECPLANLADITCRHIPHNWNLHQSHFRGKQMRLRPYLNLRTRVRFLLILLAIARDKNVIRNRASVIQSVSLCLINIIKNVSLIVASLKRLWMTSILMSANGTINQLVHSLISSAVPCGPSAIDNI